VAAGLAIVAALAAAFLVGRRTAEGPVPSFRPLTFRRGTIDAARFAPDGNTIIYQARWDGQVPEIFSTQPGSPESRSLELKDVFLGGVSSTGEMAARLWMSRVEIDVADTARRVTQPALVVHARKDRVIPYEEGRRLASLLPNAHFVTLDTDNHVLQEDEPAWSVFLAEVRAFLGDKPPAADLAELSERERDVLELVAAGMSNDQIAARLFLSPRTVERHLSNVYAKLRVSGKAGRAAAAVQFSELLRADRQTAPSGLGGGTDAGGGERP